MRPDHSDPSRLGPQLVPDLPPKSRSAFGWFRAFVPGVVAGAADLDPAAVLTATVAGATFGYSIGWVVLACIPVLWIVFSVSSRIGHESQKGLVELVRECFGVGSSRTIAVAIFVVNFAMIIGDLVAVSDSISIITQQPRMYFLTPLAFAVWYMLILGDARKSMERMGLLSIVLVAYVAAAYMATPSVRSLAQGILLPKIQLTSAYAMAVIAVFGSLLTPDVIVWQTSSKRDVPEGLRQSLYSESHAGTIVATLVSLSAIIAASHMQITDPSKMTLRHAAEALGGLGAFGPILFALGIIGSGLVALPLLTASLSFSISESAGWDSGLSKPPWEARFFYIVISGVLLVAVVVALIGVNTVWLLYWSQLLAGVLTIPILGSLLLLGNKRQVVSRLNSRFDNLCLGLAVLAMVAANAMFIWSEWISKLL